MGDDEPIEVAITGTGETLRGALLDVMVNAEMALRAVDDCE